MLPQMDPAKSFRFADEFQSGPILGAICNRLAELRRTGTAGIDQVNREGPARRVGCRCPIPVEIIVESHAKDARPSVVVICGQQPSDGPL